ncbi:alkyl hydroperoxide reductase/ Thiol specific antioxidant/ Mal allergen [Paludibacter propionicigenes WB4]|uniref:Alkyl hydroperoxide reductase/ Thiol specific antioxidant/ Mal allergen n=2 Tax=Paludibacter TaxID=346096 RepID=E4T366_PALPW|nr:alkyl hydroperoxide reductase/ Thiol specific antioxidant/ Mal allergen [Paludibacter propionicigenes WB4]
MNMRRILFILAAVLTFSGQAQNKTVLKEGIWHGQLSVADNHKAPFLFNVKNAGTPSASVVLINGEERVELTGIKYRGDSVIIPIESYDAVIKASLSGTTLQGRFLKNYIPNDAGIAFTAEHNNKNRFTPVANPTDILLDGKWDVLFVGEKGDTTRNVGIFKTVNRIVTGSILTNSGDMRFLEGAYTTTGVQLSAFAGLSPYLFELNFVGKDRFEGTFFSARSKTKLIGVRNSKAGLADPYSLTKLKPRSEVLSFKLPNINGQTVSVNDERYKNKVVIISILGSWCPNCLDEMKYLAPWYKANKARGVEIIGLSFERKDDFAYAKAAISRLKTKYGAEYEILFAGKVGDEATAKVLPEIEKVSSYPTTIFIDKKGKVRKIYTGYNGPATGLFYEEFKQEFNALMDQLLAE